MSKGDKGTHQVHSADEGAAVSRRKFLGIAGAAGVGLVAGGGVVAAVAGSQPVFAIEQSEGYLLVDSRKCGGCETCMMACSLAHYGRSNVNLSRLQVKKTPTGNFPTEIVQNQCRQCPYPSCVAACPTKAMHADAATGVRVVSKDKCVGCERCIQACPFTPSRVQWNYEDHFAQKCDLCLDTPFMEEEGGPGGTQICIAVCPMKAIVYTAEAPTQSDAGYDVNLRNHHWAIAGFPIDTEGRVLPSQSVPNWVTPTAAEAAASTAAH
jgi:Fe-S-cluster-containing dehydrogenase component